MKKLAIVDIRIPDTCAASLTSLGFEIVKLPAFSRLSEPVASHPDMLLCPIDNKIITHKEYFEQNRDIFDLISKRTDKKIIISDENISAEYPCDVSLNALIMGNFFFSLNSHTSKALLTEAKALGFEIINTKQGYAKCSVCPVSDNAAITADTSLADAMSARGIDVLKISAGSVELPPYDYGFIGGASGYDGENVYFCGSLDTHPQGKMIADFCKKHGKTPISLSDTLLLDVGTIFILQVK